MEAPPLSPQAFIAEVLASSPQLASLFVELRVDCLGCSMSKFCTLEDLCEQYQLDLKTVIRLIQERRLSHASY